MGREDSHSGSPMAGLQDRYKKGELAAFEELFRRLEEYHRRWVLRMLSFDVHATEDVLNQARMRLWAPATREAYCSDQCWFRYAVQVLRNLAIDEHRKRGRRPQLMHQMDSLPAGENDLDLRLDVHEALRHLSDEDRDLVVQRFLHGKKQTEIARERNHSNSKVSVDMQRVLHLLRDYLTPKGYGGSRE